VILDAAIRVLDKEGVSAATTSRIAEVAGVSVGTLYQYFANRDQILGALQDREFERATQMMQRVLSNPDKASDRQVARSVLEGLIELYRSAPALHRVLAVDGLRVTPAERVQAFDFKMVHAIRSFLVLGGSRMRRTNLDAAAFVVYQSVRASMLAYMLESPSGVDDSAMVEELTDVVFRYLVSDETKAELVRPPSSA
jgi:AcrR family transcriptional regulator